MSNMNVSCEQLCRLIWTTDALDDHRLERALTAGYAVRD